MSNETHFINEPLLIDGLEHQHMRDSEQSGRRMRPHNRFLREYSSLRGDHVYRQPTASGSQRLEAETTQPVDYHLFEVTLLLKAGQCSALGILCATSL